MKDCVLISNTVEATHDKNFLGRIMNKGVPPHPICLVSVLHISPVFNFFRVILPNPYTREETELDSYSVTKNLPTFSQKGLVISRA